MDTTLCAWAAALERFDGAYGGPPDLTDPEDRAAFLALLAEAVRADFERELVEAIGAASAQLLAERERGDDG